MTPDLIRCVRWIVMLSVAPVCADDGNQLHLVGVEKYEKNVRVMCRVRADPADERVQFEWLVWPGMAAATVAELHQQQSPSVVATGNYVTTALSNSRNDTAAGLVVGELELPAMAVGVADVVQYADGAPNVRKPVVLDTVSCRATNAVGRQQNPCLYHIVAACESVRSLAHHNIITVVLLYAQ